MIQQTPDDFDTELMRSVLYYFENVTNSDFCIGTSPGVPCGEFSCSVDYLSGSVNVVNMLGALNKYN